MKPRVAARSRYRPSTASEEDAETYYRVNVYIPLLADLLNILLVVFLFINNDLFKCK